MRRVVALVVAAVFVLSLMFTALTPVFGQAWVGWFDAYCVAWDDEGVCITWMVG